MIALNEELSRAAAQAGQSPLTVVDPTTNTPYVLVRKEVYERLEALLGDLDVTATADLVDKVMAEDDANDPYLESYQSITRDVRP